MDETRGRSSLLSSRERFSDESLKQNLSLDLRAKLRKTNRELSALTKLVI
jgi:hypothetical protein